MHIGRFARDGRLSEFDRLDVFKFVVEVQDAGSGVPASRELAARKFGIGVERVRSIEKEGLLQGRLDLLEA
jgi:hypothetical protein